MSTDNSITVPWPPLALGEAGWRYRLESIANQAEALIGRKVVSMQATAELALELFGLIWPAYGPETIAASARASLLLNTPVVMASAPADQLQEIAERLDAIWEAAQSDPAAAVVTVPAPLLNLVREPQSRPGRRKAADRPADSLELEVTEPTAEPDPEPAPDPVPPPRRPVEPLRPASERMVRRPDPVELPEPWRSSEPEPWPPMAEPEPEVTPAPEAPQAGNSEPPDQENAQSEKALSRSGHINTTPPPPASWLSCSEVAELLSITRATVATWRRDGRLGVSGVDYVKHGRSTYFAPAVVEQLEAGRIPAGLDQLVAEVQAQ